MKLSKPAQRLLKKVRAVEKSTGGSHRLRKQDKAPAQELVDREMCYYAMDYDHLGAYRYPNTPVSGSTDKDDPPSEAAITALMSYDQYDDVLAQERGW